MTARIYSLFTLKFFFFLMAFFCYCSGVNAQGCVAVRPMGCGGAGAGNSALMQKGDWQAGVLYRYFESFRHFRGDSEEEERVELGTQVINVAHSVDLTLTHAFGRRWSATASLPYIYYDRSSLYEHYGNKLSDNPEQKRFHTGAQGIGDLRLSASYWLLNPDKHHKSNIAAGLGLKLPTGNSNVQGEFHKRKATDGLDTVVVKAVDQSIQLGDGGVGFTVDVQGYTALSNRTSLYINGFYMFNPKETNETLTRTTKPANLADSITQFHSVADQFALRMGAAFVLWPAKGLVFSLGVRAEGVPAKDLIGDDWGFRRPGYIISAEPGLSYQPGVWGLNISVPYALYRNRVKSVSDLADPAGLRHGDAAFADYLINVGISYRFSKKHAMPAAKPVFNDVAPKQ